MSFMKPKVPKAPVAPDLPTPEQDAAARGAAVDAAQVDWARSRRAVETNVGGAASALEDQAGRGLIRSRRREEASKAIWGMNGSRG